MHCERPHWLFEMPDQRASNHDWGRVEGYMHRRQFIESVLGAGLFAVWQATPVEASNLFPALIPGADPSGIDDSTAAFQKAIASLPSVDARLIVSPGKYRFEASLEPIFQFKKINGLQIEGEGATLLLTGNTPGFFFEDCSRMTVSGITVDWPRPPFSQGIVQQVEDREFTVQVDPQFPVSGNELINTIGEYDPDLRLPSRNGVDQYYGVKSISLVAAQLLRIEMEHTIALHKGATVVLRHPVYGANVFAMNRCRGVRFDGVTIHASPGMGIHANLGDGFEFNKLRVIPTPGTNRLLSLNADAVHLNDCSGTTVFSDCEFRGMGDDAINIDSAYHRIAHSAGSELNGEWKLDSRTDYPPAPGRILEVVESATQVLKGHARVLSPSSQPEDGFVPIELLEMDSSAPLDGLVACDMRKDATTEIRNCKFDGNRARAILVHNDAKIYGNRFYGQSLPAILLSADSSYWFEGPLVRDIEIFNNHFDFNYYGNMENRRGAITIDTSEDAHELDTRSSRVYRNISIHDNQFTNSCGCAIFAARASGLSLMRNTFKDSSLMADAAHKKEAIFLNNVECSRFEANRSLSGEHVTVVGDCDLPLLPEI